MDMLDSDCVGQMLVHHGELAGHNQVVVVSIPDSSSNTAAAVRVPFPSAIAIALSENPDVKIACPYGNDDASLEVVRVGMITVVPPPFVSALLARKNHTTVEAWQISHPMCVANGWLLSCSPFLNVLRCAMTYITKRNLPIIADALPPYSPR